MVDRRWAKWFRFNLKSLALLALVVAIGAAVLRLYLREELRWFGRYVAVTTNKADLDRHIYESTDVSQQFASALQAGRHSEAWAMMTGEFQHGTTKADFLGLDSVRALSRKSSELVFGATSLFEGRTMFVSKYIFRCGADGEGVQITLITESDRLKIDSIERCSTSETATGS